MASLTKLLLRHKKARLNVAFFTRNSSFNTNVLKSNYPDVKIPEEPLWSFVFEKTYKWPNKTAIECSVTGKKLTYDQLRRQVDHFSRFLRKKLKLKAGNVVALMLPNTPEYPVGFLGSMRAGLIPTTVNPMYTEDEVFRQLKQTSVDVVVALDLLVPLIKRACNKIFKDITVIAVKSNSGNLAEGVIDFEEVIKVPCDIEDAPLRAFNETACYLYSSGTTGMPKAVDHSMQNLVAQASQPLTENFKFIKDATNEHQDVIPSVLPFYHVYGIASLMWMLHCGVKIITLPTFTPELYLNTLKTSKPNVLLTVPPLVLFLTNQETLKADDLKSVRVIISGAAPLGGLDEHRFLAKFNLRNSTFLQAYGLTETAVVSLSSNAKQKVPASAGELVPNTFAKIVSLEDGQTALGPNESGELYLKGPQICKGYLNDYEANKNVFDFDNGWFKSGDIAYYTKDGSIFITDRIKDLIKVNAYPVAPAELEEVLRSHDDIADAAVIGISDERFGQVPKAFVVRKNGRNLNIPEIHKYVEEHVAPYKKLRGGITIVESIPKLASGKILKRKLS